jgi:hypothetical protein
MKFWYSFLLILLLGVSRQGYAQTIQGMVVDSAAKQSIAFVNIKFLTQKSNLVTNAKGQFILALTKTQLLHDTVVFWCIGYRPDTVACLNLKDNMVVHLAQGMQALKGVTVRSRKSNVDSLQLRADFKQVFEFRKYKVIEAFSLTSINVDKLYAALSKKNKNKKKLRQILLNDEKRNYIDSRFNKRAIIKVAALNDEQMQLFMDKYRPSYNMLIKFSDYDLMIYIKKSLAQHTGVNPPL